MKEKIYGYNLDSDQKNIILDETKHILVVAGAGSGKTLTILGKIKYLVDYKNIKSEEILCISFTNETSNNLKNKIKKEFGFNINVYTFHKLSLEILNKYNYSISYDKLLESIIHEFFISTIKDDKNMIKKLYFYLGSYNRNYDKFYSINNKKILNLEKLIATFIHLFKTNNYNISDFNLFLKESRNIFNINYLKEKYFLIFTINIYLIYLKYLDENNEIDFDDMIIKASNEVKINGYKDTKYIIIDEYQDTSYIRFLLIKNILEKTNSKLLVVGDDYQSIYKFTGCDISLFIDFKEYFEDSKIMYINNTYRNSQELIDVASDFILKNKKQLYKKLKSNKHLYKPIKIVFYFNIKESFEKLIKNISTDILVLGRNNNDVNMLLGNSIKYMDNYIIYNKRKIKYLTIHRSKGLECDNVILINLINSTYGFPNKIKNDKVLRFVSKSDKYLYEEERRLFYVALTRTKNNVYLLTPYKNSSVFIKELISNYRNDIEIIY